ncbi:MAG: hypothetical protein PHV06_08435 [bacterium]|nr:hypothetical protein [bacterium]
MLSKVLEYFGKGFKLAYNNFKLALIFFGFKVILDLLIGGILSGNIFLLNRIFLGIDWKVLNDFANWVMYVEKSSLISLIFLLIADIIVLSFLFIFVICFYTGLRAAVYDVNKEEPDNIFKSIFKNAKYFAIRTLNINFIIASYYIIIVFVIFLSIFVALSPYIMIPKFFKTHWVYDVFMFVFAFFLLTVFGVSNIFFYLWRNLAEYDLIVNDTDWRTALKTGRKLIFSDAETMIWILIVTGFLNFIVATFFIPFRMFTFIPYIGLIFILIIKIIQTFIKSFLRIVKFDVFCSTVSGER